MTPTPSSTAPAIVRSADTTPGTQATAPWAVRVSNLGKQYRLGGVASLNDNIREDAMNFFAQLFKRPQTGGSDKMFWALRDVGFELQRGETLGVIGRNGAGKSTMLKLLSRITPPTTGEIRYRGRLASLLEVGTGFHRELTGRENIFVNGAILGMRRHEIRAQLDEIVGFAGVEKFLDTPVKFYSSGMYVRLAFAVAAHLQTDILVVDEVLAVGDSEFQKRCLGKMQDVARDGRTVLFVSHNMAAVSSLCRKGLLLEEGAMKALGPVDDVIQQYMQTSFKAAAHQDLREVTANRSGNGQIKIVRFTIENEQGDLVHALRSGCACTFVFEYECNSSPQDFRHVTVAFGVRSQDGILLFRNTTSDTDQDFTHIEGQQGQFRCRIPKLPLRAGRYTFGFRVTVNGAEADYIRGDAGNFEVEKGDFYGSGRQSDHAPVLVDHAWSLQDSKPRNETNS